MTCPTCQTEHTQPIAYCPRCGARLGFAARDAWDAEGDLIEGIIVDNEMSGDALRPERADTSNAEERPAIAQVPNPSTSLVILRPALPSLPARLWRQPAVRAVARAGAGAVALTLGMRILRGVLSRPHTTGELARSALPAIRLLFDRAPTHRAPIGATSDPDAEVVETFIYMRRVVRRR